MNKTLQMTWLAASLAYSANTVAATMIETLESDGGSQKIWVEGSKMRMESGEGYGIADWEKRTIHFVDPGEGMVLDMSSVLAADASKKKNGKTAETDVKKVGAGPKIAGYDTVHYKIGVQDTHCLDVFVSAKAMEDLGMKHFASFMQDMSNIDTEEMLPGMGNPCDEADRHVDYTALGFPLRTVEADSGNSYEVTSIERDAALPSGAFELPQGMPVMDMGQLMDTMRQMQVPK